MQEAAQSGNERGRRRRRKKGSSRVNTCPRVRGMYKVFGSGSGKDAVVASGAGGGGLCS